MTPLNAAKLRMYQKQFPNIKTAEQALEKAVSFDSIPEIMVSGPEVYQDAESLLNMAALLEQQEQGK